MLLRLSADEASKPPGIQIDSRTTVDVSRKYLTPLYRDSHHSSLSKPQVLRAVGIHAAPLGGAVGSREPGRDDPQLPGCERLHRHCSSGEKSFTRFSFL